MSKYSRDQEQAHTHALLQEAISQWRPELPRRWLARYGGWEFEGKHPLVREYRAIRRQARILLKRRPC